MSRPSFFLWISFLALFASVGLACGSGSYKIQSITVNPATADAQSYPNGQVPFVATGYYNSAPATVTPLQANWGAALGSLPADGCCCRFEWYRPMHSGRIRHLYHWRLDKPARERYASVSFIRFRGGLLQFRSRHRKTDLPVTVDAQRPLEQFPAPSL